MSKKVSEFRLVTSLAIDDYVTAIDISAPDPVDQNVICELQNLGFGAGDMIKAVYDPTNVTGDAFDYANFSGYIDAGTFN